MCAVKPDRVIILDTETTGFSPTKDRIIEIGAIELIGNKAAGSFHRYICPGVPLPRIITEITGLVDADLAAMPPFQDVAADFIAWIGDSPIVAHNAKFDMGFLNAELQRSKLPTLKNRSICTVALFKTLFPGERANLDAVSEKYGIEKRCKHGALSDAKILVQVYLALKGGEDVERVEHMGSEESDNTGSVAGTAAISSQSLA